MRTDSITRRLFRDQSGQVLPWLAFLMMFLFAGLLALVVDVGRAIVAYHMLEAATDAAVMAGAQLMPTAANDAAVTTRATLFSAVPSNNNANPVMLPSASMVSGYPAYYCSSTVEGWGVLPNANLAQTSTVASASGCGTGANAIVVAEQVSVPMYFASWLGVSQITLTAQSTAAMKGSARLPYNVAVIIDTTASMGSTDGTTSNCTSSSRVACAETGVLTLLGDLTPCKGACGSVGTGSTNVSNPFDEVALYTFPGLETTSDATSDADATSNCGNVVQSSWISKYGSTAVSSMTSPETGPPYYQIAGFSTNYATANPTKVTTTGTSANLSSSSLLNQADGLGSYCGLQAKGGASTYYAQVIYQAQADLAAQQTARGGAIAVQNVMVILSDGDAEATPTDIPGAGSTGVYPSYFNECQQAVTAANAATTAGTTVYTVAYGTQSTGCSTDQANYSVKVGSTTYKNTSGSGLTPCQAMQKMASTSSTFFSDYVAGGNGGATDTACAGASGADTSLDDIFSFIAGSLQTPRLMPNGTP